jgi:hypothetical protein
MPHVAILATKQERSIERPEIGKNWGNKSCRENLPIEETTCRFEILRKKAFKPSNSYPFMLHSYSISHQ